MDAAGCLHLKVLDPGRTWVHDTKFERAGMRIEEITGAWGGAGQGAEGRRGRVGSVSTHARTKRAVRGPCAAHLARAPARPPAGWFDHRYEITATGSAMAGCDTYWCNLPVRGRTPAGARRVVLAPRRGLAAPRRARARR